jgi:FMN reductase
MLERDHALTIRIVGIGSTVYRDSSTEQALRLATGAAQDMGAEVTVFGSDYLRALPHYRGEGYGTQDGTALVEAVRRADGVIISAPGYHGSISGLVKNALDYLEDLARDERPYLDGRAVGLIATAYGDQATMSTLLTLRSVVHALRGWPTPMGATVRVYQGLFSPDGECLEDRARMQLEMVGQQTYRGACALSARGGSQ